MRAINQCTQYLWCMPPPPASNPNLYASKQKLQEPTNQTARYLCVLWTHKMNWDSFESKNGRLASHDFRPGLQSIRAVTGRTGRFRSRDNSVCANFNHLDPAQYCDWDPAHLHFLPSKCIEYLQQGQLSKRLTLKFSFVYVVIISPQGLHHKWWMPFLIPCQQYKEGAKKVWMLKKCRRLCCILHTAPMKGSQPPPPHPYRCQPLDRLILYPPPPTSICTTKSPWRRNKSTWRLCHGPYFALLLHLLPHFPPIVQLSRFVSGKKRNDTPQSHHQRRCKKWIISNFLHFLGIPLSGQTRTTVIV